MVVRDQQAGREVVGDDRAGEAELAAQQVVEDQLRPAARDAVDGRVRVHDGREAGFGDRGAERLGVHLAQLARAEVHRRVVHPAFGQSVAEEVLAGRGDTVGEVALHAAHVRDAEPRREVRRLAVGLLGATPARVARDVEHGRERVPRAGRDHLVADDAADAFDAGPGSHALASPIACGNCVASRAHSPAVLSSCTIAGMPSRVSSTRKRWIAFVNAARSRGRSPVDAPMRVISPMPCASSALRRRDRERVVLDELGRPHAAELRELLVERHPGEQLFDHPGILV